MSAKLHIEDYMNPGGWKRSTEREDKEERIKRKVKKEIETERKIAMPLGIVDDSTFESEINGGNKTPIPSARINELPTPGRKEGDNNVPDSLRKIIGEDALENGSHSANALANSFGISSSSVSAYKNGATSTASYERPSPELAKHLDKTRERIIKRATTKLDLALEEITSEKLSAAKLSEISTVARNMAAIVKDMTPDENKPSATQNNQFILMAPDITKLDDFMRDKEQAIDLRNE